MFSQGDSGDSYFNNLFLYRKSNSMYLLHIKTNQAKTRHLSPPLLGVVGPLAGAVAEDRA